MRIHDWTRVDHGTFHDFRQGWAAQIRAAINGVLPPDYEAKVERASVAGLSEAGPGSQTPATEIDESDPYSRLRNAIVVRQDERVAGVVEVMSPGSKSTPNGVRAFVRKVTG